MTSRPPILSTVNLTREVPNGDGNKRIIDDLSISFEQGKLYMIIGPSGAGKSSLLRLLNRLDEPTGGEIFFNNTKHTEYDPCELRRKIGYLFQSPYLFDGTVRDNLRYAKPNLSDDETSDLIKMVHLKQSLLDSSVTNLSGGEKQRVSLARLLAMSPEVILLDEPTSALDPTYTEAIEDLIREVVSTNQLTALMVTHHPDQALRMKGETILLVDGKLVEQGPTLEIIEHPKSELGRRYMERKLR